MAAVDKIFGTKEEYDEFYDWCRILKPEVLQYFYPRYEKDSQFTLTNFPEDVDRWMLKNCDIDWVVERIKEQYGIINE